MTIPKTNSILALLLVTLSPVAFSQEPLPANRVWFWFGDCTNGKLMGLELFVEGRIVYHSSFRACLLERTDANAQGESKARAFYFSGGHNFQGLYKTTKREQVEGNIWEAGADPDDILLGVSFATPSQVLLNAIHIVRPGKPTQSTLDRNVIIKTYPLRPADEAPTHK
jgi:hypothetical protein